MRDRQLGLAELRDWSLDALSKVDIPPALRSAVASRQADDQEPTAAFDNYI